jgi:hypothetical protein
LADSREKTSPIWFFSRFFGGSDASTVLAAPPKNLYFSGGISFSAGEKLL